MGGYVKEYQVDLDPDAMRSYGVNIMQVMLAVKNSNIDVGAGTIEVNKAEYLIRGPGYIKTLEDLENAAITQLRRRLRARHSNFRLQPKSLEL